MNVKITINHAESTRYASFGHLVVEYDSEHAARVQLTIEGGSITVSLSELAEALEYFRRCGREDVGA